MTELVISSGMSLTVFAISMVIFVNCAKAWKSIDIDMLVDRELNTALTSLASGYGTRASIRSAVSVTKTATADGWTLRYATAGSSPQTNTFTYSSTASNLVLSPGSVVVGRDISCASLSVGSQSLVVTMRVFRAEGNVKATHEATTLISWRNGG